MKGQASASMRTLRALSATFLDLLFPRRCAGCEEKWLLSAAGHWCPDCVAALPWIQSPLCPQCGAPFPDSPACGDHLCADCLAAAFSFDWARSAAIFTGPVRDRIHDLKFGGKLHWAPALADLLVQALERTDPLPTSDVLIPVPLHRRRLRARGFNQAAAVARHLARHILVPVRHGVLRRSRWTDPQTRLGRAARLDNVRGAFDVAAPAAVEGRAVLLVDDVFTTGTTLNACAAVLKAAGARWVGALTVARAIHDVRIEEPLDPIP
jgi:ComF family protein